jgi:hypothetical protein
MDVRVLHMAIYNGHEALLLEHNADVKRPKITMERGNILAA